MNSLLSAVVPFGSSADDDDASEMVFILDPIPIACGSTEGPRRDDVDIRGGDNTCVVCASRRRPWGLKEGGGHALTKSVT